MKRHTWENFRMNETPAKCGDAKGKKGASEDSAPGLNDSLEFMGRQLHVQTEKTGFPVPRIVTQVFSNGRVVLSRKSDILPDPESWKFAKIQELMRSQHFQTIQEISDKQKQILRSRQPPDK
jgi:hypothetical protein